jgi:hypothetical protein
MHLNPEVCSDDLVLRNHLSNWFKIKETQEQLRQDGRSNPRQDGRSNPRKMVALTHVKMAGRTYMYRYVGVACQIYEEMAGQTHVETVDRIYDE